MKYWIINSDLNIFKKGEKQVVNFRPYHRDISTWNCYSFRHLAVFVLFFVQRPRQTVKIASFLEVLNQKRSFAYLQKKGKTGYQFQTLSQRYIDMELLFI